MIFSVMCRLREGVELITHLFIFIFMIFTNLRIWSVFCLNTPHFLYVVIVTDQLSASCCEE